jgi:antitoxin (DNA-binding transcriptional repressor) of toxin-antitoxin stability system
LLIATAEAGGVNQLAAQEGEASTSTASTPSASAEDTGSVGDVGPRDCHFDDPFEFECEFTVSFGSSSYSVNEGSSVTVTVRMSPAADKAYTIPITGAGTSVTFSSGQSSRTFSYPAGQDSDCADESVTLGFGSLPSGVVKGTPSSATVSITDDDICPPKVRFSPSSYSVKEGSSVTVTVRMSPSADGLYTIPISKGVGWLGISDPSQTIPYPRKSARS